MFDAEVFCLEKSDSRALRLSVGETLCCADTGEAIEGKSGASEVTAGRALAVCFGCAGVSAFMKCDIRAFVLSVTFCSVS